MCGIVAIYGASPVSQRLYEAMILLQHRGQDAAGIVTCELDSGRIYQHKGNGLVRDVFHHSQYYEKLAGNIGIGHVRYPTAGTSLATEAQPFYVNSPHGIALGHNGNLTNSRNLIRDLFHQDLRHINTDSDSEILLNVLAHEMLNSRQLMTGPEEIFHAVSRVHARCCGAYAVVALISGCGLLAFRDPHGIRPLIYGKKESENGIEYMVASESIALSAAGFTSHQDVAPGEAIYIDNSGQFHIQQCAQSTSYRTCIFEYVYFSRPDSVIDEVFVHKARMRMGHSLAKKIKKEWKGALDIDVVMPIPDTSRTAALELAMDIGVKYREGFIKNRYIGRTFIMPGQEQRNKSVSQKLHPLSIEFKDKTVLLVDDSIVRGTTSQEIVQMARKAGAKKVYFASASPPIRHPNIYGIDIPAADELVAHNRSVDQIRDVIGADRVIYQNLDDLILSVKAGNPKLKNFECSIFDGNYIHDLEEDYFEYLREQRKDSAKLKVL